MAEPAVRPSYVDAVEQPPALSRWRTVDIVVTAVLGVAFGVLFWAWNLLWAATGTAFGAFPPAQARDIQTRLAQRFPSVRWLVPPTR